MKMIFAIHKNLIYFPESDPPVRLPRAHPPPGQGGQRLEGQGEEQLGTGI